MTTCRGLNTGSEANMVSFPTSTHTQVVGNTATVTTVRTQPMCRVWWVAETQFSEWV
jgi:hypothetical protein